jgi:hypothetical protein
MNAIIITPEEHQKLISTIDEIKTQMQAIPNFLGDRIMDNEEFYKFMKISKRTAQTWRDEGIIAFAQVGGKIYYKMSDVEKMLEKNYNPAFKNR